VGSSNLALTELLKVCCQSGKVPEWEEFVRRTSGILKGTIRRTFNRYGQSPSDLIDDLLQDIYLKIAANREKFLTRFIDRQDEEIYAYLKIMAVTSVTDYFRLQQAAKRQSSRTLPLSDLPNGSEIGQDRNDEMERDVLLRQIERVLDRSVQGSSSHRDRSVFWLYYRQGLTSKAIASLPRIRESRRCADQRANLSSHSTCAAQTLL
jgi:RNA polymerase sigma-70 factor (ECF subfamily)